MWKLKAVSSVNDKYRFMTKFSQSSKLKIILFEFNESVLGGKWTTKFSFEFWLLQLDSNLLFAGFQGARLLLLLLSTVSASISSCSRREPGHRWRSLLSWTHRANALHPRIHVILTTNSRERRSFYRKLQNWQLKKSMCSIDKQHQCFELTDSLNNHWFQLCAMIALFLLKIFRQ